MRQRVLAWLTLALVAVYWGLGLPFSLFCLGVTPEQACWLQIVYLWETPILAVLLVLMPAWVHLQPVADFLRLERPTPDEVEAARKHAECIPLQMLRPILLGSLLGSLMCSLLLERTAQLPLEEVLKNIVLGVPIGLLYALLAYFILTYLLRPVLERCDNLLPALGERARVGLFWKTWACLLVAAVIPLTVMLLMCSTVAQRMLETSLAEIGDSRLLALAHEIRTGQAWQSTLHFGAYDMVAVVDRAGHVTYYRGPDESRSQLETDMGLINKVSGCRVARDRVVRVVCWRPLPSGDRLVAVLPLTQYSAQLMSALKGTLLAGAATTLVALALAWLLARNLVLPLARLTEMASQVPQSWPRRAPITDDEIGVLGKTLNAMLSELRQAQQWKEEANRMLAELLEERTRKMEQLKILLGVSRSVGSNLELDRVFSELLTNVSELLRAEACSVVLLERGRLEVKALTGLEAHRHPSVSIPDGPRLLTPGREGFPAILLEDDIRCLLSAPMTGRGGSIGAVNVFARHGDFSATQVDLLARVARLAGVAIENARLYEEKNHVWELLYRALIPTRLHFPGLEVGHRYVACKVLSGDYYDLIPLSRTRVALVMADVGGKGPEAAIQTVRAKHVVRTCALAGYRPTAILEMLNRIINEDAEGRIVTLFYAVLDLEARQLTYCNAGHEPAVLCRPDTGELRQLETTGVLLGATDKMNVREETLNFPAGASLLLYTDGVTEARAPGGEFLGSLAVLQLAARLGGGDPQVLVDELYREVDRFSHGQLGDDLTLLAVRLPEDATFVAPEPGGPEDRLPPCESI